MIKNIKKDIGFTLIEIVVSTAIVGILTIGMFMMNSLTSERRKRETFENGVQEVISYLRYARSDAISNREMSTGVPEGGYGAHIEITTEEDMRLTHFVDDNDGSGGGVKDGQYSTDDTVLNQKTLPVFWTFSLANASPAITLGTTLTSIFIPPNADMIINDGDSANDLRSAEMAFQYQGKTKRICLNRVSRFFEVTSGASCP